MARIFAVIESWMTRDFKLAGFDLMVFAFIHSITKGESNPLTASAEAISVMWFGDTSKTRTIKDSLASLEARGYISKLKGESNGRVSYISLAENVKRRILAGEELPPAKRKRRNRSDERIQSLLNPESGTVPPVIEVVPYHLINILKRC